MAEAWQYIYSGQLLILFLLAQMAPIFFEVWMEARMAGIQTSHHQKQHLSQQSKCQDVIRCLSSPWFAIRRELSMQYSVFLVELYLSLQILIVQAGIVQSTVRLVKQILTLSPVMFIFQAKACHSNLATCPSLLTVPGLLGWKQKCLRYLNVFECI